MDADGQGRAFPELQMETFSVNGVKGTPLGLANEKGDVHTVLTDDNIQMERIARSITTTFGGTGYFANYPMNGTDVKRTAVKRTLTMAKAIGDIIHHTRRGGYDPFERLVEYLATTDYQYAKPLFSGKVVDLDRKTQAGFTLGSVTIQNTSNAKRCSISFQNENLLAKQGEQILAIVPDIITILDAETCIPITNETLRYGQRVIVMAVAVPEIMRTEAALQAFGPTAFNIDAPYLSVNPQVR